jgi:hypothetical protein
MTKGVGYSGVRNPNVAGVSSSGVSGGGVIAVLSSSYTPSLVTWNPSDKAAEHTLSGGNLTITTSTDLGRTTRATKAITLGQKKYWEILVNSVGSGNNLSLGVANSSHVLAAYLGATGNSAWCKRGLNRTPNGVIAYGGAAFTAGDIIGWTLDFSVAGAGILTMYRGGVSQGPLLSTITTANGLFPAAGTDNVEDSVTARFDPSSWTYSPPEGYDSVF